MNFNEYNPYPSFQPGQAEAIARILELMDEGHKVIELNAPTAAGKSLDLFVLGRALTADKPVEEGGRAVYTTPLVALVNQLEFNEAFKAMPVLKGKRNYKCLLLSEVFDGFVSAEDCPYDNHKEAMQKSPGVCGQCPYRAAYNRFMARRFGATTLKRFQMGGTLSQECSYLFVDESKGLERALIDQATLKLPDEIDLDNLEQSLTIYLHELTIRSESISKEIYEAKQRENLAEAAKLMKQKNSVDRDISKVNKILAHIEHKSRFIIDKDRQFRLLEGKSEFERMIKGLDLVVLASGTPATDTVTDEPYQKVIIQHPIEVSRRLCYYWPIGEMNFKERDKTAPAMAAAIVELHKKYKKKTMVHCGSYIIANMLFDQIPPKDRKKVILQDRDAREDSKKAFLEAKGQAIFLSVAFEEGLDLKGPEYPLNIISKVPFENISDEFVKRRNEMDKWMRYNLYAATAMMQAAGRCTRSPSDFSETYILDKSWQGFYARNKGLFYDWFKASLRAYPPQKTFEEARP